MIERPVTIEENERITHGWRHTRIYNIWLNMRQRCNNPRNPVYHYYGGRGISICKEWDDAAVFCEWAMNNGYDTELTIDRIDVNGNYEPSNCRWVTMDVQNYNKSNNVTINIDGEQLNLSEASIKYQVPISTLRIRRFLGDTDESMVKPKKRDVLHTVHGEDLLLKEVSEKYNIPWSTLRQRYRNGATGDKLLEKQKPGPKKKQQQQEA